MSNPKRIVPIEEVRQTEHYADMADLAEIFHHDIVEMYDNVWRWKQNTLSQLLFDSCKHDLKELSIWAFQGKFSIEEWMKFYMEIGYSLSGYGEVFGRMAEEFKLPGALEDESTIDYMRRFHKGEVLRL